MVRAAERTLSAVFVKSEVQGAHAHRFRHTLATELLGQGSTSEDVADMLGNSAAIVRKHYAEWSKGRLLSRPVQPHQTRVRRVFQRYGLVVPAHRGLPGSFQNDQILET
jgi:site-specific recombinase XerD